MRIGLWGARADSGGLAAMTFEFFRNLWPERTFLIDMGRNGRGRFRPTWYTASGAEVTINEGYNDDISVEAIRHFATGLDVVYAAETFYREDAAAIMRECGVRTVLHSMPELYRRDMAGPDVIWAPTTWRLDLLPAGTPVVPVPVPTDTFTHVGREPSRRFLHVGAPAFHDRNGTELLRQALGYLTVPIELSVTGWEGGLTLPQCRVRPRVSFPAESDWRADIYDGCGALVLPRRYAGLSLPMQEAAALGFPIVTLDLEPQRSWVHPETLVPATAGPDVRMAGGVVNVADASPRRLAAVLDRLAADERLWADAAARSVEHAASIAWSRLRATYTERLEEACG